MYECLKQNHFDHQSNYEQSVNFTFYHAKALTNPQGLVIIQKNLLGWVLIKSLLAGWILVLSVRVVMIETHLLIKLGFDPQLQSYSLMMGT